MLQHVLGKTNQVPLVFEAELPPLIAIGFLNVDVSETQLVFPRGQRSQYIVYVHVTNMQKTLYTTGELYMYTWIHNTILTPPPSNS